LAEGRPGAGLYQYFEEWREEETKTRCPACKGAGKVSIEKVKDPSNVDTYRFILCGLCLGEGRVTASKASEFRKKGEAPRHK
jgi:hypothetical protein